MIDYTFWEVFRAKHKVFRVLQQRNTPKIVIFRPKSGSNTSKSHIFFAISQEYLEFLLSVKSSEFSVMVL